MVTGTLKVVVLVYPTATDRDEHNLLTVRIAGEAETEEGLTDILKANRGYFAFTFDSQFITHGVAVQLFKSNKPL